MLNLVLFAPEIPSNTGNIIRLSANAGTHLHLIEPLGFDLDDKKLRRAGLDYHEWTRLCVHASWDAFLLNVKPSRMFAFSTKGTTLYTQATFALGDTLLFGSETRGLPSDLLQSLAAEHRLYLPMQAHSRSLNLSNTVAIALYEAWRQMGFSGAIR